jgi:hypothetical protein
MVSLLVLFYAYYDAHLAIVTHTALLSSCISSGH